MEGGSTGTALGNRIDGHDGDSLLSAGAGEDLIFGYDGDDTIDGGLNADAGDDRSILDNGGAW